LKIRAIETYLARVGVQNRPHVRVLTDEDLYGIGEAYPCGPDLATVQAIHYFAEWLVGRDPLDIEGLCQLMHVGSRFPGGSILNAAISGIEQALWDIKGKALGAPVYQLIGGKCRDKVRAYEGVGGNTPTQLVDQAQRLLEQYHYTALKMSPFPHEDGLWHDMGLAAWIKASEARIAAIRQAVGDGVDIALDAHAQIYELAKAVDLCEMLQPYHPLFLEEPLRPENRAAMGYLRDKARIPIATGEMLVTLYEFRDLIAAGGADILQPDICLVGGLWEMKKIAAMAEAEYLMVAPHNPCGPVATAASVHFALSTQNFLILEYHPDDTPSRREMVDEPIAFQDGYLLPPTRPGLGLDLNLDAYQHVYEPWHRPFLWRVDGSIGHQ